MNKEWFIFKGTHHLGPYSLKEMEDLYRAKELSAQSLIWKEGSEKWEALAKTSEFKFLMQKEALPSLPDLPSDDLPPKLPKLPKAPIDEDDLPPPIPLDAILDPNGLKLVFKEDGKKPEHFSRLIFAISVILFAGVLTWFFLNEKDSGKNLRVKGIMPVYLDRLQETASLKTPSMAVSMALSLDGKTLWASSNYSDELLTIIKMQSIPKRILGVDEASIMVRGVMRDHLAHYDKMQLTSGKQFIPGEYNIDFTARKIHFLNKKFKFLNGIKFFKKLNRTYDFKGTALIYSGTPREFEKKLADYQEAITNERLKPFQDKLERLQTFHSLLNKTIEDFLLTLETIKDGKGISSFEKKYIKEVSPMIQSLVVAAHEIYKATEENETDTRKKIGSYESQVQLGKQIGEMTSDMITETGKMKKLNQKDKINLKTRFETRYKLIKTQIDSDIILIKDQIEKLSR